MTAPGYDANVRECRDINPDGTPDKAMLQKITAAIVNAMQPQRVILFGSGLGVGCARRPTSTCSSSRTGRHRREVACGSST